MVEGEPDSRVELEDVGILVTDFDLEDPRSLPPILKQAIAAGFKRLLFVAKKVSEPVITFLKSPELIKQIEVIPVKLNGFTQVQDNANARDLTALVGGYPVVTLGQKELPRVRTDDFGRARLVWADLHHIGIIGGGGDTLKLRRLIESLKGVFCNSENTETRKVLRQRIGTLQGGAITLWVGGATQRELESNKEIAEHVDVTLRGALGHSVLPGGGTAYLNCQTLLCKLAVQSQSLEQRFSYQMLHKTVEAPLRTMLENAGLEPAEILAQIRQAKEGSYNKNIGFDIQQNKIVNMLAAGVLDVAAVQKAALRYAVKSAALALSIEAVVHKKNPERVVAP